MSIIYQNTEIRIETEESEIPWQKYLLKIIQKKCPIVMQKQNSKFGHY